MRKLIFLFFLISCCGVLRAQTPATPAPEDFPSYVLGFGASYDNIAKPGITGSLLQAILLTSKTSTQPVYNFTLEDFSPVKINGKLAWQTSVTTGAATLLRSFGSMGHIWIVGTVGGGSTPTSSGLAWSAGGAWTKNLGGASIIEVDIRTLRVADNVNQFRIGVKYCLASK